MPDHDPRPGTADAPIEEADAVTGGGTQGDPTTDEPDPTFADGTARGIDDAGQPLTRQDEGMDR
jgi:hypothetical protein